MYTYVYIYIYIYNISTVMYDEHITLSYTNQYFINILIDSLLRRAFGAASGIFQSIVLSTF